MNLRQRITTFHHFANPLAIVWFWFLALVTVALVGFWFVVCLPRLVWFAADAVRIVTGALNL